MVGNPEDRFSRDEARIIAVITAKVTGEKMRDMYTQAYYDINLTGNWNAAGLDEVDTSKVYMRWAGWGCEVNLMKGNNYMYILTGE